MHHIPYLPYYTEVLTLIAFSHFFVFGIIRKDVNTVFIPLKTLYKGSSPVVDGVDSICAVVAEVIIKNDIVVKKCWLHGVTAHKSFLSNRIYTTGYPSAFKAHNARSNIILRDNALSFIPTNLNLYKRIASEPAHGIVRIRPVMECENPSVTSFAEQCTALVANIIRRSDPT